MAKRLTCIECPKGCVLSVDIQGNKVVSITGSGCPKGQKYALSEIENPVRILTTTVLAEGLSLKMVPVKTDQPIPKDKLFAAMREVKKLRIHQPVHPGSIIVERFLGLEANLVATRDCLEKN
ncbi:MAG: DUF1667 domain-containing protein [Candidatus Omnitrophota bacterium]